MKHVLSAICLATIVGIGAGVSAQAGQMDKKGMMKDGPITVSGCVAAGKDAGQYLLTNAMMAGGMMDKDKMDQEGMKKPGMGGAHMMSYELVGGSGLKAHMGHRIEVTGTLSKMDMDRMAQMDKTVRMDEDKMMADKDMKAMKLNVTSVKMVSATCP